MGHECRPWGHCGWPCEGHGHCGTKLHSPSLWEPCNRSSPPQILGLVKLKLESNFFPSILEGLLGRLSIAAHGEMNPSISAKEGVARLWASTVLNAVQKMEKRQVRLKTSGSLGMPSGLHLNYEEDFLNYQSHQVQSSQTHCSYPTWSTQCTN